MQVNLFIPGFSKCGTTSLYAMLDQHPDIYFTPDKEPGYFAQYYDRGLQWYLDRFPKAADQRYLADASTTYSSAEFAEQAIQRIIQHCPSAKCIFVVRNPADRLSSVFRELHANGLKFGVLTAKHFSTALDQFPCIVHDSCYFQILQIYRQYLADSQLHVLFSDDLQSQPQVELTKCFRFLGLSVEPASKISNLRLNSQDLKTRDSDLLRWFHANALARRVWLKLSERRRERIIEKLRLRKPFDLPVVWDDRAKAIYEEIVLPDSRRFLELCGKPRTLWDLKPSSIDQHRRAA